MQELAKPSLFNLSLCAAPPPLFLCLSLLHTCVPAYLMLLFLLLLLLVPLPKIDVSDPALQPSSMKLVLDLSDGVLVDTEEVCSCRGALGGADNFPENPRLHCCNGQY